MMAGMTDVVFLILFQMDWDYEDGHWAHFPPVSYPIRWAIMSMANLLHSEWWRFACCDSNGKRKELHTLRRVRSTIKMESKHEV